MGLHYLKKHVPSTNFHWEEKWTYRKTGTRDPSRILQKPENRDPSGTLQKPEDWNPGP